MSRNRVIVPARQATLAGGVHSLESILGVLKSLRIRALIRMGDWETKCKSRFCWISTMLEPAGKGESIA
jgi:hypothetical protein